MAKLLFSVIKATCIKYQAPVEMLIRFKEGRPTENLQLEPDIRVANDYKSVLSGKDPQLERAVKEMLDEVYLRDIKTELW